MKKLFNLHCFEVLKTQVLGICGIDSVSIADCRTISFLVMTQTQKCVSEITLKRVFGFMLSNFPPSVYTLDALSLFCGFKNWEKFCEMHTKGQLGFSKQTINELADPYTDRIRITSIEQLLSDQLVSTLLKEGSSTLIVKANAPTFTVLNYNHAFELATFIEKRNIKGMSFWDAFDHKVSGSYGPTLIREAFLNVIEKKETLQLDPVQYNILSSIANIISVNWWDIKITPLIYNQDVIYLMLNIHNVSDKILHQDDIENAIIRELTMAEDLAATNVKLTHSNQMLADSFKQLSQVKTELEDLNKHLESRVFDRTKLLIDSESKQRQLIDNAPVAIGVLKGADYIIETANKKMIEVWGKGESVLNKKLLVALPEIENQPIIKLLDEVRKSGVAFVNHEFRGLLNINGKLQIRYFDLVYQPIKLSSGLVETVFVVAIDITEQVVARKRLEKIEAMLHQAIEAASIGTWSFDTHNRSLSYNPSFGKILGWELNETMSISEAIGQIIPEQWEKVVKFMGSSITSDSEYNFSYNHRRFNDDQIISLSVVGKISFNDFGIKIHSGIVWENKTDLFYDRS